MILYKWNLNQENCVYLIEDDGQKQIQVEFCEKIIEITEKYLGIDIKKGGSVRSIGSGKTGKR